MHFQFKCPECNRAIYNRRVKTCEFCGYQFPVALLYSEDDKKRLDELDKKESRKRAKEGLKLGGSDTGSFIDGFADCGGD
ncbi:hypothetical protein IOQ59_12170 [Pontibacterium sp. N1Y112]|uniref:Uncharacterized protein n=1 Tax=Pontibacterium sinense TaxID=2781979 RepID=A0A8J7FEM8_9GAMM|nr:hypothetical protein [Pontibacterium sinense]MBE9398014.1 hypothetical protein [Pontibacterium sinense]